MKFLTEKKSSNDSNSSFLNTLETLRKYSNNNFIDYPNKREEKNNSDFGKLIFQKEMNKNEEKNYDQSLILDDKGENPLGIIEENINGENNDSVRRYSNKKLNDLIQSQKASINKNNNNLENLYSSFGKSKNNKKSNDFNNMSQFGNKINSFHNLSESFINRKDKIQSKQIIEPSLEYIQSYEDLNMKNKSINENIKSSKFFNDLIKIRENQKNEDTPSFKKK